MKTRCWWIDASADELVWMSQTSGVESLIDCLRTWIRMRRSNPISHGNSLHSDHFYEIRRINAPLWRWIFEENSYSDTICTGYLCLSAPQVFSRQQPTLANAVVRLGKKLHLIHFLQTVWTLVRLLMEKLHPSFLLSKQMKCPITRSRHSRMMQRLGSFWRLVDVLLMYLL